MMMGESDRKWAKNEEGRQRGNKTEPRKEEKFMKMRRQHKAEEELVGDS